MLRDTIDCKASTICAHTTTGSTALCGTAPWPPRPVTVMITVSDEAMNEPGRKPNLPVGKPGMLCIANTASHGNLLEQSVFEHFLRAGLALFGRLENQIQRAVEALVLREMFGGGQQHRRMAVVAACVHLAGHRARIRQAGGLVNRQRVHVGAQAQLAGAVAELELADHARLTEPAMHRVAPLLQAFGNQVAGREFLVGQLGLRVDAAAQRDHFVFEFGDARRNGHGVHVSSPSMKA